MMDRPAAIVFHAKSAGNTRMITPTQIYSELMGSDDALAAEIAKRVGFDLPPECVPGVAANARLLQHHADVLSGALQ
jgi:hypothetical protein